MQLFNKRQIMLGISISLTAYAFAISGCNKKSDDSNTAAAAANAAAAKNLEGNWVSMQDANTNQKNLYIITVKKDLLTLRGVCVNDTKKGNSKINLNFIPNTKFLTLHTA